MTDEWLFSSPKRASQKPYLSGFLLLFIHFGFISRKKALVRLIGTQKGQVL